MNILPVNNINSNNNSFRGVKVLGNASKEIKNIIYSSVLKDSLQDFFVLTKTCRANQYDYNHPAGTIMYELKLVKKPETLWGKFLLKMGLLPGEYLTNGYRSERGVKEILTEKRINNVLNKLG